MTPSHKATRESIEFAQMKRLQEQLRGMARSPSAQQIARDKRLRDRRNDLIERRESK